MVNPLQGIESKKPGIFKEKKTLKFSVYSNVGRDVFAVPGRSWKTCRDQFGGEFGKDNNIIYYRFNPKNAIFKYCKNHDEGCKNVARFINDTERKLKWKLTHFHRTQNPNTLYIHIRSKRWLSSAAFRSLFTLLLRVGVNYSEGRTYEQTLDANSYSRVCKSAIIRLLDGFTVLNKQVKTSGHWTGTFQNKKENYLKQTLMPNKDRLARQAYYEWEAAGCPEGMDAEIFEKAKKA